VRYTRPTPLSAHIEALLPTGLEPTGAVLVVVVLALPSFRSSLTGVGGFGMGGMEGAYVSFNGAFPRFNAVISSYMSRCSVILSSLIPISNEKSNLEI
jgi:hypothetical protein